MKPIVIVPTYAHIEPECEAGFRALEREGITVWRRYGCSAVDKARSALASDALARGFDRLLWIDADIGFRAEDALALLNSEHPFCCGAYVTKKPRGAFALALRARETLTFGTGGGWVEAIACGFGFVAVSAEVFRAIDATLPEALNDEGVPHRPYFLPMCVPHGEHEQYYAEDFSFCHRAREVGYRLWCDTRIRLYHVGRYLYSWEDAAIAVPRHASVVARSVSEVLLRPVPGDARDGQPRGGSPDPTCR